MEERGKNKRKKDVEQRLRCGEKIKTKKWSDLWRHTQIDRMTEKQRQLTKHIYFVKSRSPDTQPKTETDNAAC